MGLPTCTALHPGCPQSQPVCTGNPSLRFILERAGAHLQPIADGNDAALIMDPLRFKTDRITIQVPLIVGLGHADDEVRSVHQRVCGVHQAGLDFADRVCHPGSSARSPESHRFERLGL